MDIFFPKFLIQTLRKRAKRKLATRKGRGGRITAQGGGGASEEERAALTAPLVVIDGLALKSGDRLARKRIGRFEVRVRRLIDFLLCDLQKGLPYAKACVVKRYADVGCRPVCAHGAEGGLDFFIIVVGYWERGRLC